MNSKRLYDQVMTLFGTAMVFFYIGLAYMLIFADAFGHIDITLRSIFAFPFFLYGAYRAVGSFRKIKENFFKKDKEE